MEVCVPAALGGSSSPAGAGLAPLQRRGVWRRRQEVPFLLPWPCPTPWLSLSPGDQEEERPQ